MNTKQQQLLFDKGITNVPSDILCSDNTLEESVGMIYDNGEHRVIQKPKSVLSFGGMHVDSHIIYVHKYNDAKRYIYYTYTINTSGQITAYYLHWGEDVSGTITKRGDFGDLTSSKEFKVESIGKTLVVSSSGQPMKYFLWKGNTYAELQPIPAPDFKFWLSTDENKDHLFAQCSGSTVDMFRETVIVKNQEAFNNLVVGLYSKNKKTIAGQKGFCEPFLVRMALELYDGSYTHISQPIMMLPCVKDNSYCYLTPSDDRMILKTFYSQLFCTQTVDFSDYKDIVKDVVVFVSDGINIYSTDEDQELEAREHDYVVWSGLCGNPTNLKKEYATDQLSCTVLKNRSTNDINTDLESTSVFYKLCSLGTSGVTNLNTASRTPDYVVKNLTTQDSLEADDYYSKCQLYPEFIYSYNSRLNIANVSRGFFEGYDNFLPFDNSSSAVYDFAVTIKIDDGTERVVIHTSESITQKQGIYFFYPDSRATHVVIRKSGIGIILNEDLKEHPGLNGAYYFRGIQTSYNEQPISASWPTANTTPESLPNYIIQSEVNNPFIFKKEGYFKVGTGKILGISSITQALSEGQFGQYPLLVFSESGIWALSVASTGYYSSINPMSREVCNNTKSITQTDGAVFFSSEKGLMVVAGNQVSCVSEQLNGRESAFAGEISMTNFHDYLKNCFIAYDYRDSLLWIFNNSRSTNTRYCYVYSIKHGAFGKFYFENGEIIDNVVNDYPDTLLQGDGVYSLTQRPNINSDTATYSGLMITRPMKFENGLGMKSLMQVKNLRQMQGTLQLSVYASNDIEHWVQLSSLRGTPWKYFRFRFDFSNMKATDRFAGSVIITQERRTDKLR